MIETDPARAVTSLVWLAAPFAEAPANGRERVWRIVARTAVTFGPLAGLDAELFERDLRAYAGRQVLGLLGAEVAIEGDRVSVRFPLSLEQARAPAVGVDLPAGLAGRAVDDLVVGEVDVHDRRAAARAGLAGMAVDVVDLGVVLLRDHARATRPEALDALGQRVADRLEQPPALLRARAGRPA